MNIAVYAPTYTLVNIVRKRLTSWRSSHRIADAIDVHEGDGIFVIGPAIGPSAAWLVVDHLRERGIKRLGLVSVAGSLSDLSPGSIVLPREPTIPGSLQEPLRGALTSCGIAARAGKIVSSATPVLARPEAVSADAVDMELETLVGECRRHGIELACGFVISDVVGGRRAYRSPEVLSSLEALAGAVLTACLHE